MSASGKQKETDSSDSSTSASNERQQRIADALTRMEEAFGTNLVSISLALGAIYALTALMGTPISLEGLGTLFAIGVALGVLSKRVGDFSFAFWMVSSGVVVVVWNLFAPPSLASALDPLLSAIGRVPFVNFGAITPLQYAALAGFLVLTVWGLKIRVFSAFTRKSGRPEAANADTVAAAISRRIQKLGRVYLAIGATAVGLAFALFFQALSTGGDVIGELFGYFGQDPVLTAGIVNWFLGLLPNSNIAQETQGVPIIGPLFEILSGLSGGAFIVLTGFLLLIAVGAREAS